MRVGSRLAKVPSSTVQSPTSNADAHCFVGSRSGGKLTIADAGQGLRAGQKAAWGDTPCHGDVFHIQRQCDRLANTLSRLAKGAMSRRQTLQAKTGRAGPRAPADELATQLALARQT